MSLIPVTKNGKFFGYADEKQIAANPALEVFDAAKAESIEAAARVEAAKKEAATEAAKTAAIEASGGADAAAVKKGPAKS